jgi:hypothetical protein
MLSTIVSLALLFQVSPTKEASQMTNADVVRLVKAGFSEAFILRTIEQAPSSSVAFTVTAKALVELKAAGLSETIISAMIAKSKAPAPKAATPTPSALPPQPGGPVVGLAQGGSQPAGIGELAGRAPWLTRERIQNALSAGQAKGLPATGLQLSMAGWRRMVPLMEQHKPKESVTIFTPTSWLERLGAAAASEYRTVKPEDVAEDDLRAVLRVFVNFGAHDLTLRSRSEVLKTNVRREYVGLLPFLETEIVGDGVIKTEGLQYVFALSAVREAMEKGDGELDVIAAGRWEYSERVANLAVRVKRKHLSKLPDLVDRPSSQ